MIQDRQCERSGLPGARLSNADDVPTLNGNWNGLILNRSGGYVFLFGESAKDRRCEAELVKCSQRVSFSYGDTAVLPLQPAESRGSLRHPAWPGLSISWRYGGGGAKFVLMSFVHAAREPDIGSFIR